MQYFFNFNELMIKQNVKIHLSYFFAWPDSNYIFEELRNLGISQFPYRNFQNYRDFEKFPFILKMTILRFPLGIWEVPQVLKGIPQITGSLRNFYLFYWWPPSDSHWEFGKFPKWIWELPKFLSGIPQIAGIFRNFHFL